MKKLNNYICIGLFFNSLWLVSNRFIVLPEFINGLCVGIALSFMLLGIYAENHDISKLKNYKKALFRKVLRR